MILAELESQAAAQQLAQAHASADTLQKWQLVNAVLVQATLRVMPAVGFTADAHGLQQYTEAFAAQVRTNVPEARATLQQLNESKWRVLLQKGYGVDLPEPLSREKARALAIDIVDALQDEALLKQVEESRSGLGAHMSENERQHMVARALVGVQSAAMARHGFEGDGGFAQAQVCLMEHAADAVVTASVAAATTQLYARAGINLLEALRAATSPGS